MVVDARLGLFGGSEIEGGDCAAYFSLEQKLDDGIAQESTAASDEDMAQRHGWYVVSRHGVEVARRACVSDWIGHRSSRVQLAGMYCLQITNCLSTGNQGRVKRFHKAASYRCSLAHNTLTWRSFPRSLGTAVNSITSSSSVVNSIECNMAISNSRADWQEHELRRSYLHHVP